VPERLLHLRLRTPQALVATLSLRSLRVPTDDGLVGLRPGGEPAVLAVEPGLILGREGTAVHFVATAGGLLRSDGQQALLLTPVAVVGRDAQSVARALDAALVEPGSEAALRREIERLERGILQELRRSESSPRGPR